MSENLTKKALAAAMKELMQERPFEQIKIHDICDRCSLSRKSFYYHFADKYDLVNWIFDTEFLAQQTSSNVDFDTRIHDLCCYFYENRIFYRRALQVNDPSSFRQHFSTLCRNAFGQQLTGLLPDPDSHSFHVAFFTDAFICALERWLLQEDTLPPDRFARQLRLCCELLRTNVI